MLKHLLVLCGLLAPFALRATTIVPVPQYDSISGDYEMQVDDGSGNDLTTVPVVHHYVTYGSTATTNVYYGHFSYGGGTARVILTFTTMGSSPSFTTKVSPLSSGVTATAGGSSNQIYVSLPEGAQGHYLVKLSGTSATGAYSYYLIIMAEPLEGNCYTVPSSSGSNIFNITASPYNCVGNNTNDCSSAINSAISAAASYTSAHPSTPGIVYVPQGSGGAAACYKIANPLKPQTGAQMYLQGGAVIRADTNYADWPANGTNYMFDCPGNNGTDPDSYVKNFTLFGRGLVDCKGVAVGGGEPNKGDAKMLLCGFRICDCSNIVVNGIQFQESLGFMFYPDRSTGVQFIDTKVVNYVQDNNNYRENDAMDILQCQNSLANHCLLFTSDDAMAVKGGYNGTDGDPMQDVDNVSYNDMVVYTNENACKFGNAEYTNITDGTFANIQVVSAKRPLAIMADLGTSTSTWTGLNWYGINAEIISSGGRPMDFENTSGATNVNTCTINDFNPTAPYQQNSYIENTTGSSLGDIQFTDLTINGAYATSTSTGDIDTNSSDGPITFTNSDTNLISGMSPSSESTNWAASPNGYADLTDGSVTDQAEATNTSPASVQYSLSGVKTIDRFALYQDYGSYNCQYVLVQFWNTSTNAWNDILPSPNFDAFTAPQAGLPGYAACPVDGWTYVSFPPVQSWKFQFTFVPFSGTTVGVQEIQLYGH